MATKNKKSKSSGQIVVEMSPDKETKGAWRYSDGESKNIYFRKDELEEHFGGVPESITVTIEAN